jgi:hypothetical protein
MKAIFGSKPKLSPKYIMTPEAPGIPSRLVKARALKQSTKLNPYAPQPHAQAQVKKSSTTGAPTWSGKMGNPLKRK